MGETQEIVVDNDNDHPIMISVKFCTVDGNSIGFWYPVSQHCDFDKCKNVLRQLYPNARFTDDLNVHNVLGQPQGFVECGSKFGVDHVIKQLCGLYYNRRGQYHHYFGELDNTMHIYHLNETGITIAIKTIGTKKCVFWWISGNVRDATQMVNQLIPNVRQYQIDDFDQLIDSYCGGLTGEAGISV
jgi:hypothetical protein